MPKHNYTVTLTEREGDGKTIDIDFPSHDDVFAILAKVSQRGLFDAGERERFVVGLKMFASVMLAHRDDPLFAELAPHFGAFMKTLKASA